MTMKWERKGGKDARRREDGMEGEAREGGSLSFIHSLIFRRMKLEMRKKNQCSKR
jgi:hypothetical protein